jgi:hypothetical protein
MVKEGDKVIPKPEEWIKSPESKGPPPVFIVIKVQNDGKFLCNAEGYNYHILAPKQITGV